VATTLRVIFWFVPRPVVISVPFRLSRGVFVEPLRMSAAQEPA